MKEEEKQFVKELLSKNYTEKEIAVYLVAKYGNLVASQTEKIIEESKKDGTNNKHNNLLSR